MKTKQTLIACFALLAMATASNGAVTISFNSPFIGGLSSNLANQAGVVSNGLQWGLIVDGTGNGILDFYDAVVTGSGLFSSSVLTDDFLFLATTTTSDSSQGGAFTEGDFATPGGNGGIGTIAFDLVGSAGAGDAFRIVWFDGSKLGELADASFILPADGQIVTLDAPFVGVDPTRNAGLSYLGTAAASNGDGITIVPEPSAALLGVVGALGLLRRRRN